MSRTSAGRAIANVLSLRTEEKITSVIPVRRFDDDCYLMMATRARHGEEDGPGRVQPAQARRHHRHQPGRGRHADRRGPDPAGRRGGAEHPARAWPSASTRTDARAMGRNTRGVKGISLQEGDEVVGMVVADPEGYLLTVCENGYGKRTPFGANIAGEEAEAEDGGGGRGSAGRGSAGRARRRAEEEAARDRSAMRYRKQRRGGKGLRDIRTSERNGPVVGVRRGARRRRHHAHHHRRHGQPHARQRDPRRRPQHAGRAHHEPAAKATRSRRSPRWRGRRGRRWTRTGRSNRRRPRAKQRKDSQQECQTR